MRHLRYVVLAAAVILLAAFAGSASLPYGSNQVLARGDVVAQVGDGHFVWNTNPGWSSTDGTEITYNDFTTYVKNNGSCTNTYGTGQLETQAMADACKVTTSTIVGTTDPWLTAQGTDWPTQSGTPAFVADTSAPGAPGGAYNVGSTSATSVVWQAINSGASLLTGTTITATAEVKYSAGSADLSTFYTNSSCTNSDSGTLTAQGVAKVEVLSASGTVESASTGAASTSYASNSAAFTVTAAGVYYVGVLVQQVTNSKNDYVYDPVHGTCSVHTVTVTGNGYATDIGVSN